MRTSTLVTCVPKNTDLYCTYRMKDGRLIKVKRSFQPYFYAPKSKDQKLKPIEKKSNLQKIFMSHPSYVGKYREQYDKGHGFTFESDVLYDVRFMIDNRNEINDEIEWSFSFIDIEANLRNEYGKKCNIQEIKNGKTQITAITRLDTLHKKIFVYSTADFDKELIYKSIKEKILTKFNNESTDNKINRQNKEKLVDIISDFDLLLYKCKTEKELLEKFLDDFNKYETDIVTGWNVHFDYITIFNRCKHYNMLDKLSYFKGELPYYKEIEKFDKNNKRIGTMYKYWTPGYYVMDYLEIYKKRNLKDEKSWTLDYITKKHKVVAPKVKHNYGNDFDGFCKNDPDLFIYYNIIDVISLYLVDKDTDFMSISKTICNSSHVPFIYCTSNRFIVDGYLITVLEDKDLVRITPHTKYSDKIPGAFVACIKGFHRCYFCDLDYSSMYPNIMIALNISPETYIEPCMLSEYDDEDIIKSPVNTYFSKKEIGILPEILRDLFIQRKTHKKQALEHLNKYKQTNNIEEYKKFRLYWNKQLTEKTILNSFYGVMSDPKYSLYKPEIGGTVTGTGQYLIKYAREYLNNNGYTVLYTDTDSVYIKLKDIDNKLFDIKTEAEDIAECVIKIQEIYNDVNAEFEKLAKEWNCVENRFEMKTELLGRNIFIMEKKMYSYIELLGEDEFGELGKLGLKSKDDITNWLLQKDMSITKDRMVIKGMPIIKSEIPNIISKYMINSLFNLLSSKWDKDIFSMILDEIWKKRIIKEAKNNPKIIAKTIKKSKEPEVMNKEWRAILKYNETHDIPIELGEKVYCIKVIGPDEVVVWKMNEEPPKMQIDWTAMYESVYKNLRDQFIKVINEKEV